jgi:GTPase SAR1 family protein
MVNKINKVKSVLISFVDNEFPSEHVPTAFDNYSSIIEFNEKPYNVGLWDTSGQGKYIK